MLPPQRHRKHLPIRFPCAGVEVKSFSFKLTNLLIGLNSILGIYGFLGNNQGDFY
jgi:hypothetical protein